MGIFSRSKKILQGSAQGRSENHVPQFQNAPHYNGKLDEALEYFAATIGTSDDYMVRVVEIMGTSAALLFISSVTDPSGLSDVLQSIHEHSFPRRKPKNMVQYMIEEVISASDAIFMTNLFELREAIVSGNIVFIMDGDTPAIVMGAQKVEHRTPDQPFLESSSRGSQVSFVEDIHVNVGLVRKALKTDSLRVKKMKIGYRSRTEVAVIYMEDVANPIAVDTVMKRLTMIHIDVISQSAAIEQRIVDNHWTIYPLARVTQRIDSSIREINQGKILILVDGDPTSILVPATLQDFFQTEEDYAHSYFEATLIRWLRAIAFVFALFLPALYIAFVDYSPELLPKTLGLQIAKSREGVPFPAVIEVVMMQIVIEILREATLRMPKQMGQTLGIVGGLVVGEASVAAGLVSNILIIVISMTAISVFVTPSYEFATVLRQTSWFMIVAAGVLGLYGIVLFSILMLYHWSSLKSFGVSYLDPFNGEHIRDVFTDGIIRLPVMMADRRASHLHTQDDTGASDYHNPVIHPQLEKMGNPMRDRWRKRGKGERRS